MPLEELRSANETQLPHIILITRGATDQYYGLAVFCPRDVFQRKVNIHGLFLGIGRFEHYAQLLIECVTKPVQARVAVL